MDTFWQAERTRVKARRQVQKSATSVLLAALLFRVSMVVL